MKSLALSLLVALGVTLGTANAFADTPRAQTAAGYLASAQSASQKAAVHAQRARDLRATARTESQAAQDSMRIANDDMKQGFTYEAGVQRAKAQAHLTAAQNALAAAAREEAMAAACRSEAQRDMDAYQKALAASVTPKF